MKKKKKTKVKQVCIWHIFCKTIMAKKYLCKKMCKELNYHRAQGVECVSKEII